MYVNCVLIEFNLEIFLFGPNFHTITYSVEFSKPKFEYPLLLYLDRIREKIHKKELLELESLQICDKMFSPTHSLFSFPSSIPGIFSYIFQLKIFRCKFHKKASNEEEEKTLNIINILLTFFQFKPNLRKYIM